MRWNYFKLRQLSLLQSAFWQLLQIAPAFLLQGGTRFITNCDRYYKVRWIYYKLWQVLQRAMIITNCDIAAGATYPRDMALCALCSPYFWNFIARCLIEMYLDECELVWFCIIPLLSLAPKMFSFEPILMSLFARK